MKNIILFMENEKFIIYISPRKAYRPWLYSTESETQFLANPEALAMAGMFVIPLKENFDEISNNDIEGFLHSSINDNYLIIRNDKFRNYTCNY